MDHPAAIVRHWFAKGEPIVRPVTAGRGFSGARHWQVESEGKLYILRQWPEGSVDAGRLAFIHRYQERLASHGLPVPVPLPAQDGRTFVEYEGCFWEVATWMPGRADYWSDPRPQKLAAALQTLAKIHRTSELGDTKDSPFWMLGLPYGLEQRRQRLKELIEKRDLDLVRSTFVKLPDAERSNAQEALVLVERLAPRELTRAERWHGARLPLATCLRDIWHDHVLFTGDRVTGVIDFGAVATGAPAGDIARLLGSLVGDDRERWAAGLAAYEAVRPLTAEEREAVPLFDSTGIVLSAANWLVWLYGPPAARLAGRFDRDAALSRFHALVGRLRNLAAAAGI